MEEGARIQLEVLDRRRAAGDALAGWKVGLTSGQARNAFGLGVRPFGHILASRVYRSGDDLELTRITRPGLETELCFRLGARLAGGEIASRDVRAALASVMPAFEINEDRIDGPRDPGIRVADNLRHWGVVLGQEVTPFPQRFDWDSLASTLSHDGRVIERVSAHGHIDDHVESIATLARQLSKFDLALEENAIVITGSFTRQELPEPGSYVGTFGELGTVTVALV
jgi:2-keto-4-pentenoate hydratase